MLQYQFRPIEQWPGDKTKSRRRSQFSAPWSKTLDMLESELGHLQARNVIIQAAVQVTDIRNDGMLRANSRPTWPGVILSFDSKRGPLSYPCDTFDDWQSNVRAIALALEALRSIDRYGVSGKGQQYRGWERIGGPTVPTVFESVVEAANWLVATGGGTASRIIQDRIEFEAAPDRRPECAEAFKKVQAAKEMLEKHFGSAA